MAYDALIIMALVAVFWIGMFKLVSHMNLFHWILVATVAAAVPLMTALGAFLALELWPAYPQAPAWGAVAGLVVVAGWLTREWLIHRRLLARAVPHRTTAPRD